LSIKIAFGTEFITSQFSALRFLLAAQRKQSFMCNENLTKVASVNKIGNCSILTELFNVKAPAAAEAAAQKSIQREVCLKLSVFCSLNQ